jgi:hypothetical protein
LRRGFGWDGWLIVNQRFRLVRQILLIQHQKDALGMLIEIRGTRSQFTVLANEQVSWDQRVYFGFDLIFVQVDANGFSWRSRIHWHQPVRKSDQNQNIPSDPNSPAHLPKQSYQLELEAVVL